MTDSVVPRRYSVRVAYAALFDVAVVGIAVAVRPEAEPRFGVIASGFLTFAVVAALVVLVAAPLVSYRRRDALLGPWIFWTVVWRLAGLPYRDWPPRDDEAAHARYLLAEDLPGRWQPEFAGMWRLAAPETR